MDLRETKLSWEWMNQINMWNLDHTNSLTGLYDKDMSLE